MAVIIKTSNPHKLLEKIYKAVDEKNADKWTCDKSGRFTYSTFQWRSEAWLKPEIWLDESELRLGIRKRKGRKYLTSKLYNFYHSKFVETMLTHFVQDFSSITVTAQKTAPDEFENPKMNTVTLLD